MNRQKIFFIIILIIAAFVVVSYLLFQLIFPKKSIPVTSNTPEALPKNQIVDQEQLNRDSKVGQLIHQLPYSGQFFTMDYSFSSNQFVVTIQQGQESQSNQELDLFLKQNGIENRSWIKNLTFITKIND